MRWFISRPRALLVTDVQRQEAIEKTPCAYNYTAHHSDDDDCCVDKSSLEEVSSFELFTACHHTASLLPGCRALSFTVCYYRVLRLCVSQIEQHCTASSGFGARDAVVRRTGTQLPAGTESLVGISGEATESWTHLKIKENLHALYIAHIYHGIFYNQGILPPVLSLATSAFKSQS